MNIILVYIFHAHVAQELSTVLNMMQPLLARELCIAQLLGGGSWDVTGCHWVKLVANYALHPNPPTPTPTIPLFASRWLQFLVFSYHCKKFSHCKKLSQKSLTSSNLSVLDLKVKVRGQVF